jgi:hypothetical protein
MVIAIIVAAGTAIAGSASTLDLGATTVAAVHGYGTEQQSQVVPTGGGVIGPVEAVGRPRLLIETGVDPRRWLARQRRSFYVWQSCADSIECLPKSTHDARDKPAENTPHAQRTAGHVQLKLPLEVSWEQ